MDRLPRTRISDYMTQGEISEELKGNLKDIHKARHISASKNLQREDLSAIEVVVEIVDAELIEDTEYPRSEGGDRKTEVRGRRHWIRRQRAEGRSRKAEMGKTYRSGESIIRETSFNHKQQRSRFEGFQRKQCIVEQICSTGRKNLQKSP